MRVFVDYRDFQRGADDVAGGTFEPDWARLVWWLGIEAVCLASAVPASAVRFEGAAVYVAVTRGAADGALRSWAATDLAGIPGVSAVLTEVEGGTASLCDSCGTCDGTSGRCGSGASVSAEEAVSAAVRADLLRLSREDAFDWAVVASSDRRLAAVARLLVGRGHRLVHAGFPPRGRELAAACSASLDLRQHLRGLERV